jgi:hypothetical protein
MDEIAREIKGKRNLTPYLYFLNSNNKTKDPDPISKTKNPCCD